MPGFNQRGPMNEGPMTGRGMGQCNTAYNRETGTSAKTTWNTPGYGYGQGRGMGRGRRGCEVPRWGMGMGRRAQMPPQPPPVTKTSLADRARQLEAELEAIQNELKQMEDQ
ncbi:hypothetical protein SAMN02746065_12817 [Desulfocicer vacuolatum DSM 3385]|uniref:DUF5320 domain-containing protein n=1 Tax=Desulfocicer vacuolatum DSM 3385 TaxID=1121400 RepID=A0A1W2ECA6_9BACT|nr:DUF5320 domain-containing protein [Desulfocicer vacuolatum]SMD07022.1 hypothetical protein SAMN02746065_12817 [Desulfocicer vacuolatum DSM 3385]